VDGDKAIVTMPTGGHRCTQARRQPERTA